VAACIVVKQGVGILRVGQNLRLGLVDQMFGEFVG